MVDVAGVVPSDVAFALEGAVELVVVVLDDVAAVVALVVVLFVCC